MPVPFCSILHIPPTNLHVLGAKQEPNKKVYFLMSDIKEFSGEKGQENGPLASKEDETERATGVGRRTRDEIAKWNQMTALRFQTGGRHQTSPASLRGSLEREKGEERKRARAEI